MGDYVSHHQCNEVAEGPGQKCPRRPSDPRQGTSIFPTIKFEETQEWEFLGSRETRTQEMRNPWSRHQSYWSPSFARLTSLILCSIVGLCTFTQVLIKSKFNDWRTTVKLYKDTPMKSVLVTLMTKQKSTKKVEITPTHLRHPGDMSMTPAPLG